MNTYLGSPWTALSTPRASRSSSPSTSSSHLQNPRIYSKQPQILKRLRKICPPRQRRLLPPKACPTTATQTGAPTARNCLPGSLRSMAASITEPLPCALNPTANSALSLVVMALFVMAASACDSALTPMRIVAILAGGFLPRCMFNVRKHANPVYQRLIRPRPISFCCLSVAECRRSNA